MTRHRGRRLWPEHASGRSIERTVLSSTWRVASMTVPGLMLSTACDVTTGANVDPPPPCDRSGMLVVTEFAGRAGRVIGTEQGLDGESPEVCFVDLAVPKSRGSDPVQIIDEAVTPVGWVREGEATWVNPDGFKVRARDESLPDDPGMPTAEYEVWLYGTAKR